MHITKDEFYEKIKDFKTKEEFEQEIKKLRKEYDDLFDEETIAWLIVDKLGRNTCNTCKITDLTVGMECTVTGVVNSIAETKSFNRKNGSTGKVVNLEISDETGVCRLVLWDKNVELVENNILKTGDRVKIVNGYVKNGLNGVEINVGRWGTVEILTDEKNKLLENYILSFLNFTHKRALFRTLIKQRLSTKILRPLKNVQFCSRSRKTKILTTGIH